MYRALPSGWACAYRASWQRFRLARGLPAWPACLDDARRAGSIAAMGLSSADRVMSGRAASGSGPCSGTRADYGGASPALPGHRVRPDRERPDWRRFHTFFRRQRMALPGADIGPAGPGRAAGSFRPFGCGGATSTRMPVPPGTVEVVRAGRGRGNCLRSQKMRSSTFATGCGFAKHGDARDRRFLPFPGHPSLTSPAFTPRG